ncbi:uncharacterized protein LOC110445918 [Mizuhopecten yessoensis]|uniref:uncharacterized protein LOC110445918 n=1 Tax=Mizuhopecten yessoensis TaxID=6573 RepID=UPI000B45E42C|nr:uncharacterized protein LOC110445918 [Mizuhopecten yessoensis]
MIELSLLSAKCKIEIQLSKQTLQGLNQDQQNQRELQDQNIWLQTENEIFKGLVQEQEQENRRRHSTVGTDGHRWYWKNERDRTWEEFDDANNDRLERKRCKGKRFAHVQEGSHWQQVTFDSMKMKIINFDVETEVKRSGSKPLYEGFAYGKTFPSDDDRDQSKPMKRNKKKNREKDTMQPLSNRDDQQRQDYAGEGKLEQQLLRKGGDDRSDPDGSDTDHEKRYTEIPPPTDKRVVTLPDRSSSSDRVQKIGEADFSTSDDDDDESKPGRRNKKKDVEKDKRYKNGRQKDDKHDKRTGKRKSAQQRSKRNGDERSDPDGSDSDNGKHYTEKSTAKKDSAALPGHSSSYDTVCQTEEFDEDGSQSDHGMKKWKQRRKKRESNEDKQTRQASGKQSYYIAGDVNTSDEISEKKNTHHQGRRRDSVDEEGQTISLDDTDAEPSPPGDDSKKHKSDGSDSDNGKHYTEKSTTKKDSAALPGHSSSYDTVCQTEEFDEDDSQSDHGMKKWKQRRKKRESNEDKQTRQASGKQSHYIAGDGNTSDKVSEKNNTHHQGRRRDSVDEEGQTISLDDTDAEPSPPGDDSKKHKSGKRKLEQQRSKRFSDERSDPDTFTSPTSTEVPELFEEISVRQATVHGNVRLLRALALSSDNLTESGQYFPLHTATSLGLKRTASFLLQSGFDLDEQNDNGHTPIQLVNPWRDNVLCEYIQKVGGTEVSLSTSNQQPCDERIHTVNMERVDLSTSTVYLPSAQFRSTFMRRDTSRKMFFVSRFLSKYATVCKYQMHGLLWLLGRYITEDYYQCLNDIVLPEKNLLRYKECSTGVIDFCTWIKCRGGEHTCRNIESDQLPDWIRTLLQKKSELSHDVTILCDGWTPMHYAVLTSNNDLVKQLLDTGKGYLTEKTHTLLPKFILDQLKGISRFEYEFVYNNIEGFTPLMLATFTENQTAIKLIGQRIETFNGFNGKDIADCLTLAYCEETEKNLLDTLCRIGKQHLLQKHHVDVNLQPFYRKKNPMRRVLLGSSTEVFDTIKEDFFAVQIIVENKAIISEYLNLATTDEVPEEEDRLLAETIRHHSDRLWKRHSSLNAIMPGHVSSLPDICPVYSRAVMVVFHSIDKELIPSSELPFQEYLLTNGSRVLVHVMEGSFRLTPTTEKKTVQVGRSIDYDEFRATLGTLVESSQKQIGILTCAHTFLSECFDSSDAFYDRTFDPTTSSEIKNVHKGAETRLKVFNVKRNVDANLMETDSSHTSHTTTEEEDDAMDTGPPPSSCGFVRRLLLRPDKEVGIDAALILFHDDDSFTRGPHLHLEHSMAKQQLNNLGIQNMDHLQFNNGDEFECKSGVNVLKCGIGTGLTSGVIRFKHATGQVRISDNSFEPMGFNNGKSKHIMKGQLVVEHTVQTAPFFAQGDSGSAVFLMDKRSPLKCIGMGIGHMTKSPDTLVTPIRSVLEAISEGQDTTYSLLNFQGMPGAHAGVS